MIFDPDHMSVLARNQALDLVERCGYPGVITSHSWSTDNALPRISALGGLIGPAAKSPQSFVADWQHIKSHGYGDDTNPYLFGFGYGADMNGFASAGRTAVPADHLSVPVPDRPGVTIHQQESGTRTFDYNVDGTAHYGLYPDWAEAVRLIGGPAVDRRHGERRRGLPADVGARERRAGPAPRPLRSPPAPRIRCAPLRAELKNAKKKKAKRKLRKKLRKQGCLPKKKKKKRKKRQRDR